MCSNNRTWSSHLHAEVKVGGLAIFSFDKHFFGRINQKHQAVSPCDFVI